MASLTMVFRQRRGRAEMCMLRYLAQAVTSSVQSTHQVEQRLQFYGQPFHGAQKSGKRKKKKKQEYCARQYIAEKTSLARSTRKFVESFAILIAKRFITTAYVYIQKCFALAVYHHYYKKCCSSIRLLYTFRRRIVGKWPCFGAFHVHTRARAGKIIVKYFVSTGPIIFPWRNSILRRIISLYLKAIARFSYKIRIKIFFARGALLFSYPRHRAYHGYCAFIIVIHFFIEVRIFARRIPALHLRDSMSLDDARRSAANFVFGRYARADWLTRGTRISQREYVIKDAREKFKNTPLSRAVTSR